MSLLLRFSNWWSKDPMKGTLYLLVPLLHIGILSGIYLSKPNKPPEHKKLVVKTWTAPKQTVKTSVASKPAAKPAPKKEEKKAEKKVEKPIAKPIPLPKKQEPIKKKTVIVEAPPKKSISEQHLKEIEERIAKIEAKNDRMLTKSELTVPKVIALSSPIPVQTVSDLAFTEQDEDPASFLVGYLQASLQLPDFGEVQIQLSLRKDGSIENIKVIKAESEKNKKYLEEHLTKLNFPSMNILSKDSSRSFLLTFCNKF